MLLYRKSWARDQMRVYVFVRLPIVDFNEQTGSDSVLPCTLFWNTELNGGHFPVISVIDDANNRISYLKGD
jgi:hypothetical protein